jgi:hypothetical protein
MGDPQLIMYAYAFTRIKICLLLLAAGLVEPLPYF